MDHPSGDFWEKLENLIAASNPVIDRPKDTAHPRYPDLIYPLDYGFLEDTTSPDGAGIDVWVGSLPERRLKGIICTVDLNKRDSEIKIILGCTDDEIAMILKMLNDGSMGGIWIPKPKT
ncbi:MAG: inorganic pyrophosphatase [Anaerolineaceae bacterium]